MTDTLPPDLLFALSIVAALVPTIVYVLLVWWLDRYEKEPIKLLVVAFFWGAVPAIVAASIVEIVLGMPLVSLAPGYSHLVNASLIAPPVEEILKAAALLGIFVLARYEFDGLLDGVVYGSLIGFGFAMTENVFYFWGNRGTAAEFGTLVLGRAVIFGLNHAMFTSLTGIGFGLARYAKTRRRRGLMIGLGLLAGMTAHFFHNLFLSIGNLCVVSLLLDWLGVSLVLILVVLAWRREKTWLRTELRDEVSTGVLTEDQYDVVTSWNRRMIWSWRLLARYGWQKTRLWRQLMRTATELALKKHQLAVMGEERDVKRRIESLRASAMELQEKLDRQGQPARETVD